jgi:binding-protein-dependent transport system inner membrane component
VWVDFFIDPRRNLTIMLLPALCLGTASAANIARTTRACMLDVLRSEYIRTAAAKGLDARALVLKHALKNALIPVVTVAWLQMGILLGGTVVVEEVFTLPGVGRLVLWSIYQRDLPAHPEHHPLRRAHVHDHQPRGGSAVRVSGSPDPLQQVTPDGGSERARRGGSPTEQTGTVQQWATVRQRRDTLSGQSATSAYSGTDCGAVCSYCPAAGQARGGGNIQLIACHGPLW